MILGEDKKKETVSWHPECAKCIQCDLRLLPTTPPDMFKVDDEKMLWCTKHWLDRFSDRCDACGLAMSANEEYLKWPVPNKNKDGDTGDAGADGERMVRYHYHCMSCVGCNVDLADCVENSNYHAQIDQVFPSVSKKKNDDDDVDVARQDSSYDTIGTYCNDCHNLLSTPLCTWCGMFIAPGTPSKALANGSWWHEECFACIFCENPISGSIHPWKGEENIFCCKEHFIEEFLPSCVACGEFILDKAIPIFGQHYHMKCITCVECGINAVDGETKQVRGRSFLDAEEGGTHSWLVCSDHQPATQEMSKDCLKRVHQMCSRVVLEKKAKVARAVKHESLLLAKRTKLEETAGIQKIKLAEKEMLVSRVESFYLKGGKKYAYQQKGESKN